jgi:hypothetical protein
VNMLLARVHLEVREQPTSSASQAQAACRDWRWLGARLSTTRCVALQTPAAAAFSLNRVPSRVNLLSTVVDLCLVVCAITRSWTPALAGAVANPARKFGGILC